LRGSHPCKEVSRDEWDDYIRVRTYLTLFRGGDEWEDYIRVRTYLTLFRGGDEWEDCIRVRFSLLVSESDIVHWIDDIAYRSNHDMI
jgi:hypothetical protein